MGMVCSTVTAVHSPRRTGRYAYQYVKTTREVSPMLARAGNDVLHFRRYASIEYIQYTVHGEGRAASQIHDLKEYTMSK